MPRPKIQKTPPVRAVFWSIAFATIIGSILLLCFVYTSKKEKQPVLSPPSYTTESSIPSQPTKAPEVTSSTRSGWKIYRSHQPGNDYQIEVPESWKIATYKDGTAAFDPTSVITEQEYATYDLAPGAITIRAEDAWMSGVIGTSSMEKRFIGINGKIETRYSKRIGKPDETPNPFWVDRTSEIYYGWNNTFLNMIQIMYLNTEAQNASLQNTFQQILNSVERL